MHQFLLFFGGGRHRFGGMMNDQNSTLLLPNKKKQPISDLEPSQRRILLVDDDQITRDVVGRMVSQTYFVDVYASPQAAKDDFVSGKYDVALIDLGMTQMRGDILEAHLRIQDAHLATVLITGWLLDEGDARASGFDFCIHKPVEMAAMMALIDDAILLHDQRVANI